MLVNISILYHFLKFRWRIWYKKYEYQERSLSIKDMMSGLSQKLDEMLVSNNMIKEVMIEPGRSIIGPAGITLYECAQIKKHMG